MPPPAIAPCPCAPSCIKEEPPHCATCWPGALPFSIVIENSKKKGRFLLSSAPIPPTPSFSLSLGHPRPSNFQKGMLHVVPGTELCALLLTLLSSPGSPVGSWSHETSQSLVCHQGGCNQGGLLEPPGKPVLSVSPRWVSPRWAPGDTRQASPECVAKVALLVGGSITIL